MSDLDYDSLFGDSEIKINCPECNAEISITLNDAGKTIVCPKCSAEITLNKNNSFDESVKSVDESLKDFEKTLESPWQANYLIVFILNLKLCNWFIFLLISVIRLFNSFIKSLNSFIFSNPIVTLTCFFICLLLSILVSQTNILFVLLREPHMTKVTGVLALQNKLFSYLYILHVIIISNIIY